MQMRRDTDSLVGEVNLLLIENVELLEKADKLKQLVDVKAIQQEP